MAVDANDTHTNDANDGQRPQRQQCLQHQQHQQWMTPAGSRTATLTKHPPPLLQGPTMNHDYSQCVNGL
jgi:hypothetical protein